MSRPLLVMTVLASGLTIWPHASASAQPISIHNPYRSYSLTGLSYGATQWERTHASRSTPQAYAPSQQPGYQAPGYYQSPDARTRRMWKRCR